MLQVTRRCLLCIVSVLTLVTIRVSAQELDVKININKEAISNTKVSVFEALEKQLTEFMNTRHWTGLHFSPRERIECQFLITVASYSDADNSFTCSLVVTSSRPVFGSIYKTTVFSTKDADFNFMFQEFDNIEFRPEAIDNNLTAVMAYWAYMIIGLDMDTFSPMGGTEYLKQAAKIVEDSQNLGYPGWKAFDSDRNRYALVNDYLDSGMEPYRQLYYDYHRCGLDSMHVDAKYGRERIAKAMTLLKQAHEDKPLSILPQLFAEFKRDEIINVFSKQGTASERDAVYDIVNRINPSMSNYWDEMKK